MCLTLGWIFIYVHSTSSRYLEMMAYFESSQTFKMFYFHPWGRNQGWVERKHMMAIFHGTSRLTFPERTCLFGFYSIASREREKETVPSLFRRLGWLMVSHQRFVLAGMTLGSVSFSTEIITITKALPWILKALALTTNTKAVPNCTCHGLLLCQTLPGINHMLGLWGSFLVLFAIGMSLKLKSVPLRHQALCVCCIITHSSAPLVHQHFVLQGQLFFYFCGPTFSFWNSCVLSIFVVEPLGSVLRM